MEACLPKISVAQRQKMLRQAQCADQYGDRFGIPIIYHQGISGKCIPNPQVNLSI
jgi:hypothetical protein